MASSRRASDAGLTGMQGASGIAMMLSVQRPEEVGGGFVSGVFLQVAPAKVQSVAQTPEHPGDTQGLWQLAIAAWDVESLAQTPFVAPAARLNSNHWAGSILRAAGSSPARRFPGSAGPGGGAAGRFVGRRRNPPFRRFRSRNAGCEIRDDLCLTHGDPLLWSWPTEGEKSTGLVGLGWEFFPEAFSRPFPHVRVHSRFDFPPRTTRTGIRVLHVAPG